MFWFSFIAAFVLCIQSADPALAQGGVLSGRVLDPEGEPVSFVNLVLTDTQFGGWSVDDGTFSIERVPLGPQTLLISHLEYNTIRTEINVVGDSLSLGDIYLERIDVPVAVSMNVTASPAAQRASAQIVTSLAMSDSAWILLPTLGRDSGITHTKRQLLGPHLQALLDVLRDEDRRDFTLTRCMFRRVIEVEFNTTPATKFAFSPRCDDWHVLVLRGAESSSWFIEEREQLLSDLFLEIFPADATLKALCGHE